MRITLLISLVLFVLLFIVPVKSVQLNRVPPIVWQQTNKYVEKGLETLNLEIHFGNPCKVLQNELSRIKRQNAPKGINPAIPPMNQAQNTADATRSKLVSNSIAVCNTIYSAEFLTALNKFNEELQGTNHTVIKRQLAEFIGGLFFSNIVETVKEKVFGHQETDLESRVHMLAKRINELNERTNLDNLQNMESFKAFNAINHILRETNDKVNAVIDTYPSLTFKGNLLIQRILLKAQLLVRLHLSIREERIDLLTLSQLLPSLEDLRGFKEIIRSTAYSPATGVLRISLQGRKKNLDSQIYHAESVRYWINLPRPAKLMEYSGPEWIVKNFPLNCVVGIPEPQFQYTTADCNKRNFEDSRLKKWIVKQKSLDIRKEVLNTSIIYGAPFNVIYCLGQNITIDKETFRCPYYPFSLSNEVQFNTSDQISNLLSKLNILDNIVETNSSTWVHFESHAPFEDDNVNLDKLHQLLDENDKLNRSSIAFSIMDKDVSWAHVSSTTTMSSIILLIVILFLIFYYGIRHNIAQIQVLSSVYDQTHGQGAYDQLQLSRRQSLRQRTIKLLPKRGKRVVLSA